MCVHFKLNSTLIVTDTAIKCHMDGMTLNTHIYTPKESPLNDNDRQIKGKLSQNL